MKLNQRLIVPLAGVTALALLVAWFPLSTLFSQSAQFNATAHQLALLRAEGHELTVEQRSMSSDQAAILLAREEYQLVEPGQRLIQVLSSGHGLTDGATGDPGDQPLVTPSTAGENVLGEPSDPSAVTAGQSSTLWSRVLGTLEFWR
jgi:hypothetical protein